MKYVCDMTFIGSNVLGDQLRRLSVKLIENIPKSTLVRRQNDQCCITKS